jgi:hypothetical protein
MLAFKLRTVTKNYKTYIAHHANAYNNGRAGSDNVRKFRAHVRQLRQPERRLGRLHLKNDGIGHGYYSPILAVVLPAYCWKMKAAGVASTGSLKSNVSVRFSPAANGPPTVCPGDKYSAV